MRTLGRVGLVMVLAAGSLAIPGCGGKGAAGTLAVTIECLPAPREVWVDGVRQAGDPTSISIPAGAEAGSHEVVLKRAGFLDARITVTGKAGETVRIQAAMPIADPSDPSSLALLSEALGDPRTPPEEAPSATRGGMAEGITIYWPQKDVRLQGLSTYRVDAAREETGGMTSGAAKAAAAEARADAEKARRAADRLRRGPRPPEGKPPALPPVPSGPLGPDGIDVVLLDQANEFSRRAGLLTEAADRVEEALASVNRCEADRQSSMEAVREAEAGVEAANRAVEEARGRPDDESGAWVALGRALAELEHATEALAGADARADAARVGCEGAFIALGGRTPEEAQAAAAEMLRMAEEFRARAEESRRAQPVPGVK